MRYLFSVFLITLTLSGINYLSDNPRTYQVHERICSELYYTENGIEYRWRFPSNISEVLLNSAYTLLDVRTVEDSDQMVMLFYDGIEGVYPLVTANKLTPDNYSWLTSTATNPIDFTISADGTHAGEVRFFRNKWDLAVVDIDSGKSTGIIASDRRIYYDWLGEHTLLYATDNYVEMTGFMNPDDYSSVLTLPAREVINGLKVSPDDRVALLIQKSENREVGILSLASGDLQRIALPGTDSRLIGWLSNSEVVVQIWNNLEGQYYTQLLLINPKTGTSSLPSGRFTDATLSRAGDKLALYVLNQNSEGDIYVYDGLQLTRINTEPVRGLTGEVIDPLTLYWSPDGTQLGFSAWVDDNFGLFTIDIATQTMIRLINKASFPDRIIGWLPCVGLG